MTLKYKLDINDIRKACETVANEFPSSRKKQLYSSLFGFLLCFFVCTLLNVNSLFLTIAISLVVAGFYYNIIGQATKEAYIKRTRMSKRKTLSVCFSFDQDGFTQSQESVDRSIKWQDVIKFIELDDLFILLLSKNAFDFVAIKKAPLSSNQDEIKLLREYSQKYIPDFSNQ